MIIILSQGRGIVWSSVRRNVLLAVVKELLVVGSRGEGGSRQGQVWEHEVLGSAAQAQSGTASSSLGDPCRCYTCQPQREEPWPPRVDKRWSKAQGEQGGRISAD